MRGLGGPGEARRWTAFAGLLLALIASPAAAWADAPATTSVEQLRDLSIEQLANLQVTSVTKAPEPLSDAPASIYVITSEEIMRSGATTLPEMLRLAPNLFVAQTSASSYVISARGLNGNNQAQSFSDKLLVLIDGRSVYTPLFSGVYWDMRDLVPEDIDRIEVISGPGAALWGANAVNGVINVISKSSSRTQGGFVDVGGGNLQDLGILRYGGRISPDLTYRAYVRASYGAQTLTSAGDPGHDHRMITRGGFRFDWAASAADQLTLQGDAFQGGHAQLGAPDEDVNGRNLLARWDHAWQGGAALQVQAYYDRSGRTSEDGGGSFWVDTYDLDVQHSFTAGRHQIVAGGGYRSAVYTIHSNASLLFSPSSGALNLANGFVQDTISLARPLKLTLGLKLEDDPYSGVSALPNLRLSFTPGPHAMFWAAASRAIRSPTPFDRDVMEKLGALVYLIGDANFRPEKLTAYEAGVRMQPARRLSFSVSGFYNVYNDLRSIEPAPGGFIPIRWGNGMQGHTYGLDAWGDYQLTAWWRLSAGLNLLSEHLKFRPGASGFFGILQAGDDPARQASLKSSMNLGRAVTLDADLRYVSALPNPQVPSYVELNSRIGWDATPHVQLALSGFNLLHARHQEYPGPGANAIPRSVFAELRVHF